MWNGKTFCTCWQIFQIIFLPAAVQALLPILQPHRPSQATDTADRSFFTSFFHSFFYDFNNLFQGWMGSGYNLDPAKIGQEGYNLLKYYEQQLKALQVRAWDLDETIMIFTLREADQAQAQRSCPTGRRRGRAGRPRRPRGRARRSSRWSRGCSL